MRGGPQGAPTTRIEGGPASAHGPTRASWLTDERRACGNVDRPKAAAHIPTTHLRMELDSNSRFIEETESTETKRRRRSRGGRDRAHLTRAESRHIFLSVVPCWLCFSVVTPSPSQFLPLASAQLLGSPIPTLNPEPPGPTSERQAHPDIHLPRAQDRRRLPEVDRGQRFRCIRIRLPWFVRFWTFTISDSRYRPALCAAALRHGRARPRPFLNVDAPGTLDRLAECPPVVEEPVDRPLTARAHACCVRPRTADR